MAEYPSIPREAFGAPQNTATGAPGSSRTVPTSPDLVADSVVSRPLAERMASASARTRIGVVIELRSTHPGGVSGAADDVEHWLSEIAPKAAVRRGRSSVSNYVAAALTPNEIRKLAQADKDADGRATKDLNLQAVAPTPGAGSRPAPRYAIDRMWPNFEIHNLIHRSVVTTKADAAQRAFEATGEGIVWAVLDSGIQADHAHFATHRNTVLPGQLQHMNFVDGTDPLVDEAGHGTHVAGILAGEQMAPAGAKLVAATWYQDEGSGLSGARVELDHIRGMAPRTTLLSCKVLRADGSGDVTALLDALEYISDLNKGGRELNVHGVNLSVGYPFDPSWFGTGLTPVCQEVDRLVRSGVLVVVAAGNSGYGIALDAVANGNPQMHLGFAMTINDPGNTERALTVGSTSVRPHLSGVSYFSSKGPTGDGRMKPDLVAPGERIVSAGAGALLARARQRDPDATYVEDSGTSMAAPHVSGVAAGLLSVSREFIGRPEEVKRILMDTATDLGRVPTFQGKGLVDSMRAIQSV